MKYIIKIPEPCHEDWSKMTPTEKGKFCASCQKEVIDFTNYSNYELVRKLDRNESVCGRFKETQLNNELKSLKRKNHAKVGFAASFIALFSSITPIFGQQPETPKIEVNDSISDNLKASSSNENNITIKGTVLDETSELPGASIIIKGTRLGTETDFDGNFSIDISKENFKEEVVLVISFLGFKTEEIIVNENSKSLKIILMNDPNIEPVLVVAGWPSIDYKRNLLEKVKDSLQRKKIDCAEPVKPSKNKQIND